MSPLKTFLRHCAVRFAVSGSGTEGASRLCRLQQLWARHDL